MKSLNGVVILSILGFILGFTNPSEERYQEYAVEQLTNYLKEDGCREAAKALGDLEILNSHCQTLVETASPQFKTIIEQNTIRKNFIFLSLYQTDLSLPGSLPDYRFRTLGILHNFYIYEAEKQL
ncbi:MAG: DUF4359 domain-containing protein [Cyanobacteria bacterium J083]|nr:MAG: DUF4359 domain-containing protein [Cyanobacteria bacterium J083]